jgi:mannan endo-1,4-beta-mannosidase
LAGLSNVEQGVLKHWRTQEGNKSDGTLKESSIRIGRRRVFTRTGQQNSDLGSAFDGSEGVDSEDILGIPEIDFSTFQFCPDQDQYEPDDPNLSPFNNTIRAGLEWIKDQAQTAKLYGTFRDFDKICQLIDTVL